MNTTGTRHTATTLTTAAAVAAALTIISASAPTAATAATAASANMPDPLAGPTATQCGEDVDSTGSGDAALDIAHRKAQMGQYYIDHAQELHQLAAR
jgi:hypothetical protein